MSSHQYLITFLECFHQEIARGVIAVMQEELQYQGQHWRMEIQRLRQEISMLREDLATRALLRSLLQQSPTSPDIINIDADSTHQAAPLGDINDIHVDEQEENPIAEDIDIQN